MLDKALQEYQVAYTHVHILIIMKQLTECKM